MNKMVIAFYTLVMVCAAFAHSDLNGSCSPYQISFLIIDTDGHDQHQYRNLMLLAESVGFSVEYRNFYTFLESNQISDYDVVFFVTSVGFFKNIQSPLIQKCIKNMQDYARIGNKTIGILIPGMPTFNDTLYTMSAAFIESCGVFAQHKGTVDNAGPQRPYFYALLKTILKPDSYTGHLYGTTLINEKQTIEATKPSTSPQPIIQDDEIIITPLPRNQNFSARARSTLPAGIYIKNSATHNRYFISKTSEFMFADMAENFFKSPLHLEDRNELLRIAQQMLWELYQAVRQKKMPLQLDQLSLELPAQLTLTHMHQEKAHHQQVIKDRLGTNKEYAWIFNDGISCAWEAPDDYFLYDDETLAAMDPQKSAELKVKALDEGISFLYDAGVNLVWFEFNAEAYLSDHARFKKDKQRFINQVHAIARQLKHTAHRLKKPVPKVFIGTDITTNFATHLVTNQAQDIFGHTYTKIPSPLDLEKFWKPEVIEPFDLFCKIFTQHLPITGIFLDFEMYHAPEQATSYTDHMDFSHDTWQHCCHTLGDGSSCGLSSVAQRVDYLLHNQLFKDYFSLLEHNAADVGKVLKEHVRTLMPNILIAAYLPTLPTSWFYRGILRGLSSQEQPVITATFNTDFYSHAQWLTDNNIHLIHGTPLLLSKIQSQEDCKLIPQFLRYHDFVWYNRPSRMVYRNKKGKWWSTEASPVQSSKLAQEIKKVTARPFDDSFYTKIGHLIWRNECGGSQEKLTWWNDREEFASLGIGHFIWYPAHEKKIFTQTFTELLAYLHNQGISIPAWLGTAPTFTPCPWQTREQFFAAIKSDKMIELRALLSSTIDLQTKFIVMRAEEKLNALLAQTAGKNKSRMRGLIKQLQQSPNGMYALIDYLNFKGEGINLQERYQGKGWGLLQVLENMQQSSNTTNLVRNFADAAKKLLTQRVKNSPAARHEQKFLAGWLNRINTYTQVL